MLPGVGAALTLGLASTLLLVQPALDGATGGTRRAAGLGNRLGPDDQFPKAVQARLPVGPLRPELIGDDHQLPLGGDSPRGQIDQSGPHSRIDRNLVNGDTKLGFGQAFVDVLSARPSARGIGKPDGRGGNADPRRQFQRT